MSLAIGSLHEKKTGNRVGTTFAVTPRFALTAFHCVGSRETAEVQLSRVQCKWADSESTATVVGIDRLNDIALLKLDRILPTTLSPVELALDVALHTEFTAPGSPTTVRDVFNYAASGKITWLDSHLDDGSVAFQLACFEAQDLALAGLSGAPVLIGNPLRAVGIVRRYSPRDADPNLASGGSIFAAPAQEALDRWPQIDFRHARVESLFDEVAHRRHHPNPSVLRDRIATFLVLADLGLSQAQIHHGEQDTLEVALHSGSALFSFCPKLDRPEEVRTHERNLRYALCDLGRSLGDPTITVLTDGASWRVYRLTPDLLPHYVADADLILDPARDKSQVLVSWLEALLATKSGLEPTPENIRIKLGVDSPAYALQYAQLYALYAQQRARPTTRVKRDVWAKLLTTASGSSFENDDRLFVNHTLLVAIASVIGHIVMGFSADRLQAQASSLTSGELFTQAQVHNVVEADFFDWPTETSAGVEFVRDLVRRLARFKWDAVNHDVLKIIYESIIPQEVRKQLGEYYTPDWLAEYIVEDRVSDPLSQRVLDASCGSGTFLFHAVRRYIVAAEASGMELSTIIKNVRMHVIGLDVHPVAVTLARVTYLLALGVHRVKAAERPAFSVPVYLADSLRWAEETSLWSGGSIKIPTALSHETFVSDPALQGSSNSEPLLQFPQTIIEDIDNFDRLVSALAERAISRSPRSRPRPVASILEQFGVVDSSEREMIAETYQAMCRLHDEGRDHVWGYYVRNVVRPTWLAQAENQVDVLVGNPPWLAYRFMTALQQPAFRAMSKMRQLWKGGTAATNQDLSALFVARCIELYLRPAGKFGYVMPLAVRSRQQYAGFRAGEYPVTVDTVRVAFDKQWDLHQVKPKFFPQSVGVVLGRRLSGSASAEPLPATAELWSGRFKTSAASRAEAAKHLSRTDDEYLQVMGPPSPYFSRFAQGATVVPRFLFLVKEQEQSPLGSGAGRVAVRSRRSLQEKPPWKGLDSLDGTIEKQFIHPVLLGETLLPYRILTPTSAVIPVQDGQLLDDDRIVEHRGLVQWWTKAERSWEENRRGHTLQLIGRLNYHRGLSRQLHKDAYRVVYAKSGAYVASAVLQGNNSIIDHKLYWAAVPTAEEARFLVAVLNSEVLLDLVRPLQARGEHNPRDLDKNVLKLSIPLFDSENEVHQRLAELAQYAAEVAARVELPAGRFEAQRRAVRQAVRASGIGVEIDSIVKPLLSAP